MLTKQVWKVSIQVHNFLEAIVSYKRSVEERVGDDFFQEKRKDKRKQGRTSLEKSLF